MKDAKEGPAADSRELDVVVILSNDELAEVGGGAKSGGQDDTGP